MWWFIYDTDLKFILSMHHIVVAKDLRSNDEGFLSRWISFPKTAPYSSRVARGLFMRALSPARSPLSNDPFSLSSDLLPLLYNYRRRCLRLLIRSPPPLPPSRPPSRPISEIISLRSNVKLFFPVIEPVFFLCPIPCAFRSRDQFDLSCFVVRSGRLSDVYFFLGLFGFLIPFMRFCWKLLVSILAFRWYKYIFMDWWRNS